MPSNKELLAAAERLCNYSNNPNPEEAWLDPDDCDIAANALRILATAGGGFEAWAQANDVLLIGARHLARSCWQAATAAANVAHEAETDELEKDKCVIAAKYEEAQLQIATHEARVRELEAYERFTASVKAILEKTPEPNDDYLDIALLAMAAYRAEKEYKQRIATLEAALNDPSNACWRCTGSKCELQGLCSFHALEEIEKRDVVIDALADEVEQCWKQIESDAKEKDDEASRHGADGGWHDAVIQCRDARVRDILSERRKEWKS